MGSTKSSDQAAKRTARHLAHDRNMGQRIIPQNDETRNIERQPKSNHHDDQRLTFLERRLEVAEHQLAATTRRLLNERDLKKKIQKKLDAEIMRRYKGRYYAAEQGYKIDRLRTSKESLMLALAFVAAARLGGSWGIADGLGDAAAGVTFPVLACLTEMVLW